MKVTGRCHANEILILGFQEIAWALRNVLSCYLKLLHCGETLLLGFRGIAWT